MPAETALVFDYCLKTMQAHEMSKGAQEDVSAAADMAVQMVKDRYGM